MSLARTLNLTEKGEQQRALHHLLRHPLTLANRHSVAFELIDRHHLWLRDFFERETGWKLTVERRGGFARLSKVPAKAATARSAWLSGRTEPFDRRRYTLLSLCAAALDSEGVQTTLEQLSHRVRELSIDCDLTIYDATALAERRAFTDVLKWLVELGLLNERDGDADGYARSGQGDVLYDINEHLLSHLLASPRSPALLSNPAELCIESYAETDEGRKLYARHQIFRQLLDEPLMYYEQLEPELRDWLEPARPYLYQVLERDLNFSVERRLEGMAAIDSEGTTSDQSFPDADSAVKHAALLLCEQLANHVRTDRNQKPRISIDTIRTIVRGLIDSYGTRCNWRKIYLEIGGDKTLATDCIELLSNFMLLRKLDEHSVEILPAIARFSAAPPKSNL